MMRDEEALVLGRRIKPYPRHCAECGQSSVFAAILVYRAEVKHDGCVHCFSIPDLAIDRCDNCRTEYFTNRTNDQITAALRRHLGMLQPEEIQHLLANLGLSQLAFADQLGVAAETVSRWLNGLSIQTRSLDKLMRVYFDFPDVRAALAAGKWSAVPASAPTGIAESTANPMLPSNPDSSYLPTSELT